MTNQSSLTNQQQSTATKTTEAKLMSGYVYNRLTTFRAAKRNPPVAKTGEHKPCNGVIVQVHVIQNMPEIRGCAGVLHHLAP